MRLNNHLEHGLLPESQCGFRKESETVDMVFAAREASGTEHWPLLNLCWSDQGIWHGQQRQPLENHGKMTRLICYNVGLFWEERAGGLIQVKGTLEKGQYNSFLQRHVILSSLRMIGKNPPFNKTTT